MRIRHKPHARPTLEACPFFVAYPQALRGGWHNRFENKAPLHLELGCGKGEFIADMAADNPTINFIAVDIKDEILLAAKEAAEARAEQAGRRVDNLVLTAFDIERIGDVLAPADRVARIYINFPNPWPKLRHRKHRLIHARQIKSYLAFLEEGGEIFFRTDDADMFEDGLADLKAAGFCITFETRNLLKSAWAFYPGSEHQRMFAQQGVSICFCTARLMG